MTSSGESLSVLLFEIEWRLQPSVIMTLTHIFADSFIETIVSRVLIQALILDDLNFLRCLSSAKKKQFLKEKKREKMAKPASLTWHRLSDAPRQSF
jgi:hypothetical protein